jgi:two-component system CheB/CheR fusion protein
LFEFLPISAFVLDERGVIQQVNHQLIDLFSFQKRYHLMQHSIYRLLPPESANWIANALVDRTGRTLKQRLDIYVAQALKPVMAYCVKLNGDSVASPISLLMLVDLSAEQAQEEQRRLFEAFLNNSPALMYAFDQEGRCILANQKVADTINKANASELIGQQREAWMRADEAQQHREHDVVVFNTGKTLTYDETLEFNGRKRYFISHKFPLMNRDGEVYAVAGITNDITNQRNSELRLKIAMEVFSKGSEGIIICDADNHIISVNKAFETITGYREQDVLGKNPRILSSGRQPHGFYVTMWDAIIHKGYWDGELWCRRKTGDIYPEHLSISTIKNNRQHVTHYIGVFSDITDRKQAEEAIHQLAFYDVLTGAANRFLLRERAEQTMRESLRDGRTFALMFIDLDHFKEVNDVFGHDAGDLLLKEVSKRIKHFIRPQDTLSRLGGDEFVVLLNAMKCDLVVDFADRVITSLVEPYLIQDNLLNISASIGVSVYPDHGLDYDTLLKHADVAMYQAKAQGRNTYVCFQSWMEDNARTSLSIDIALREAMSKEQFCLALQPQIGFSTGKLVGFEALLRWQHPDFGWVSPDKFIPVAEKSDFIIDISDWVIHHGLQQLQRIQEAGYPELRLSVNISAREFRKNNFLQRIQGHLNAHPAIRPDQLELEITERLAMSEPERVIQILQELRTLGVRLALDDFGTGYSSLSYLKRYPLQLLKIDQSFVRDIGTDSDDEAICQTILALAKTLNIETIAEGVETEAQACFLRDGGCQMAQGYLYAKPLLEVDLMAFLKSYPKRR